MGYALNHPQNKQPPSQLPETPNNKEPTMNHLSVSFLDNKTATERIIKVTQRELIGSTLTHGACTKIGKIIKKEDHSLKEIGLDKKVFLKESNLL